MLRGMPIASATPAVSPQILAALAAIQQSQAAELQTATALVQGVETASLNANLGQIVNLSA
ncbi:MAG TPA: hypothetical protein VEH77_01765 [Roseiarcus sp.]|nr:hypothetical protein [Roseiarcus sp.]